jgi:hypothetical protein
MSFLAEHYDGELTISRDDTPRHMDHLERNRLTKALAIVAAAQEIPRRLGADASGEELAADKRRCRRVSHALGQCVKAWGGTTKIPANKDEVLREAAQLNWATWQADLELYLNSRIRYVATWQVKTGGDQSWAKKAVVRLQNELRWVQYALR